MTKLSSRESQKGCLSWRTRPRFATIWVPPLVVKNVTLRAKRQCFDGTVCFVYTPWEKIGQHVKTPLPIEPRGSSIMSVVNRLHARVSFKKSYSISQRRGLGTDDPCFHAHAFPVGWMLDLPSVAMRGSGLLNWPCLRLDRVRQADVINVHDKVTSISHHGDRAWRAVQRARQRDVCGRVRLWVRVRRPAWTRVLCTASDVCFQLTSSGVKGGPASCGHVCARGSRRRHVALRHECGCFKPGMPCSNVSGRRPYRTRLGVLVRLFSIRGGTVGHLAARWAVCPTRNRRGGRISRVSHAQAVQADAGGHVRRRLHRVPRAGFHHTGNDHRSRLWVLPASRWAGDAPANVRSATPNHLVDVYSSRAVCSPRLVVGLSPAHENVSMGRSGTV